MFAIAFDLDVANTLQNHPKGVTQAYTEIKGVLGSYGFVWRQGSLYTTQNEDLTILFAAIQDLNSRPWFPLSVKDIRAFRVEQWSDFTAMCKAAAGPKPSNNSSKPRQGSGSGSGP